MAKLNILDERSNIIPKKSLGQNFLIDSNILEKISKLDSSLENFRILEIGPGYLEFSSLNFTGYGIRPLEISFFWIIFHVSKLSFFTRFKTKLWSFKFACLSVRFSIFVCVRSCRIFRQSGPSAKYFCRSWSKYFELLICF